ncbi:heterokaryon incompatibility protein-domain-containing protein [Phaeosphaeriaceae sp. PMI808]|nr:heterokaryon incompatibility protein-domain-containing protein [Phaeosphaeriaceae sp. PMI808]
MYSYPSIKYQPLKQRKNEIRLLTIHPPHSPPLPCSPEYYSLEYYSLEHCSLESFSHTHHTAEFEEHGQVVKWLKVQEKRISNLEQSRLSPAQGPRDSPKSILSGMPPLRALEVGYVALSYTWRENSRRRTIAVNGARVEVTENLSLALRTLQDDPDILQGSRLWVDMLCINQTDPEERAQQVKRMRQIYTLARRVIVWPGPEAENSDKAIDFLCSIYAEGCGKQETSSVKLEKLVLGLDRTVWESIQQFFLRRYFRRLWILQELATGARNALVIRGACQVRCRSSAEISLPTHRKVPDKQREGKTTIFHTMLQRIYLLNALKLDDSNPFRNVYKIFNLGITSQVTDERDRIYGLMGLMHCGILSRIKPNYEKTILEVYYDFSTAFIKATQRLDIIYLGSLDRTSYPSPTWIPNWSTDREITVLGFSNATSFSACGGRPAEVDFPKGCSHLSCKGVLFDVVEKNECCQPAKMASSCAASCTMLSPLAAETDSLKVCLQNTMVMAEPPTEALNKGFSIFPIPWCDDENLKLGAWAQPGWKHCLERYKLSFDAFQQFRLRHTRFNLNGRNFKDFFPPEVTDCTQPEEIGQILESIIARLSHRRLVGTQGGFLGLATENVQDGDLIFILLGCGFPLVLRPQGRCYRVVGEIFVYGIMDGKVMDQLKQGHCALQEVILC